MALPTDEELGTLLHKIFSEMKRIDHYFVFIPSVNDMEQLKLIVWQWLVDHDYKK